MLSSYHATVSNQLRMSEKLRRQLEDQARANRRSLNCELVQRLEQSLTQVPPNHRSGYEEAMRDKIVEELIKRLRGD